MIFAVTLFFALVTLHIIVECIVCNTFIYLSEHLPSVTVIIYYNTFFSSSNTRYKVLPRMQRPKSVTICQKWLQ